MISNSILFDGYEHNSFDQALYFMENWPDTQYGHKNLKNENNFSYEIWG